MSQVKCLLLIFCVVATTECRKPTRKGEFLAGTFILTQQSLHEAPYRYAGILRDVLDRVESKQPPSQSDEANCDVRYRIEPSDRRSKLQIIPDTLSFSLRSNNTLVISAKIDAEVSAKTWIWKGISFGLLGCMKINSCNGQIVTYTAGIDFQVAIQVFWDPEAEKMAINVKPVETDIHDVNVAGCKPPWYLFWFQKWQSLLNAGVQEAFQQFAQNYEHQSEIPEEFSPMKNVFIHYVITGLEWSEEYIMFEAHGVFFMTIEGQNVTFVPQVSEIPANKGSSPTIPMKNWSMKSRSDSDSNLLQGVRISNEFINAIMWMASTSNLTEYRGSARVMDTQINGTISYEPPVIRVEKDNRLSLDIGRGLLLATCLPLNSSQQTPSVLFKAEFSHLIGSGQIVMTSTEDKTGVRATLDSMDLSRLQTKPFEPKLPLPESFESALMKTGISQLQPIVNQYLENKPFYLPEKIAPLVASPQVHLFSTGNGSGYIEVMSYCTCSNSSRSIFAACDKRSHICEGKEQKRFRMATNPPKVTTTKKSLKNSFKDGFDKIKSIAGSVISNPFGADEPTSTSEASELLPLNFTEIFEMSRNSNLSYVGFHFTFFEFTNNCQLFDVGSAAKSYWLWLTSRCTPIFIQQEQTQQFYFLGEKEFRFGCEDSDCSKCQYDFSPFDRNDKSCKKVEGLQQSYFVGKPLIYSWESSDKGETNIIANVFFDSQFCLFHRMYIEPQILSSHTNLGPGYPGTCGKSAVGSYTRNLLTGNYSLVAKADWDCLENCYGCIFKVTDIIVGSCHDYKENVKIDFTKTLEIVDTTPVEQQLSNESIIYLAVGIVCSVVSIGVIIAISFYCKRNIRQSSANLKSSFRKVGFNQRCVIVTNYLREFASQHFGIRFMIWKKEEWKNIREDIIQNLMGIINGVLAIQFAFSWNSENNPLFIIHDKFKTDLTVSMDVLDTSGVVQFASKMNLTSYLINLINGSVAIFIVVLWCFTKTGTKSFWQKLRLCVSVSLLGSIFCMLAGIIFTTYFDTLVVLEKDKGFFITDNKSMYKFASEILKISLDGISLTVISFTIVFLFHSVGGGLYTGTVLFRLSHLNSKRPNMEVLTTLLVILTIIQPFVCLHPVIIWSQDSNSNSTFLLLIIVIWFSPVCIHVFVRAITNQSIQRCNFKEETRPNTTEKPASVEPQPSEKYRLRSKTIQPKVDTGRSRKTTRTNFSTSDDKMVETSRSRKTTRDNRSTPETPIVEVKMSTRRRKFIKFFDVIIQVFQLTFFLSTFTVITHYIVNTELSSHRENLQKFVLPAIISVFFWTVSISYLVLSIVLDETRKDAPLVFKDQDLEAARKTLRSSLRRRLSAMDRQVSRQAQSLQRKTFFEAAAVQEERRLRKEGSRLGRFTLPQNLDLSESLRGTQVPLNASFKVSVKNASTEQGNRDIEGIPLESISSSNPVSNDEASSDSGVEEEILSKDSSWWGKVKRLCHFLLETEEYKDPQTHGWRIKFRRIYLTVGVVLFTCNTILSTVNTQTYSSKAEIQKILDYTGMNLTWPDSGSVLDDVFQVYNDMERLKCYLMIGSSLTFWISLILDFSSHRIKNVNIKSWFLSGSRVANFAGSLVVFASVIVVGLPDYLDASNLDTICPFCGYNFNRMVRQVAEFAIGLFFACLFTFQLFPILVTIAPALVRASVLILIHPQLQVQNSEINNLRMTILQRVIQFSSLLTFPITFISMAIVQQYQKDVYVSLIIIGFWLIPPLVLYVGLHYARKFRRYIILLWVYYFYNVFYITLLLAILLKCMTFENVIELLRDMLVQFSFWAGFLAQITLCNVVISDMLYMTVF